MFSNFANGWPGLGLFLQRLLTGTLLIHGALLQAMAVNHPVRIALQLISAVFLMFGLGTPIVGTFITAIELWMCFSAGSDPVIALITSALGATLAMIGPGAWSADARIFGRKHIKIPAS